MQTFKQFFEANHILAESRRNFLKTLFGTAAAAAVSNPAKIAAEIAKKAGSPWLKMTLEGDFAFYDNAMVGPEVIGTLTKGGGKYIPGISDSGDVIIDFDDSAIDLMQVYVKPGTDLHNKLKAGLESDEGFFDPDDRSTWGDAASTFEQEVFKTVTGSDSSTQWYEDQIESQTEQAIERYGKLPDHHKDGYEDVDEDGYQSQATMDSTDQAHRYLKWSSEDTGIDVPEEIKAVIERGYMKSYARGAGSGNEAVTTDSLEKLRKLTGDVDLEDPDEDDLYRWLEGEADNVHDKFRSMGDEAHGDYEQLPGTGADTSWDDGLGNVLSLAQVLAHAEEWNNKSPEELEHLMIPTERDPARVQAADTSHPLLIAYDGMKPIKILDGQHRLQKALNTGMTEVPINRVDINSDPKLKQMFGTELDENI